jgi:hypothetical protein
MKITLLASGLTQCLSEFSFAKAPGGTNGFRVDDANGKRLGYFYSWDDANAVHPPDDVLTADEARRIAEEFAKLPEP